jgi:hypothetical protein
MQSYCIDCQSFNTLKEYAGEFFSFLNGDARIFPAEIQKAIFLDNARSAAVRVTTFSLHGRRNCLVDGLSVFPELSQDRLVLLTVSLKLGRWGRNGHRWIRSH